MARAPSFPRNLSLHVLSRERESRSLKLLMSTTDWMPASVGMTNYDTVSKVGRGRDEGGIDVRGESPSGGARAYDVDELWERRKAIKFSRQAVPIFLTFMLRNMEQLIVEQKARELRTDVTQAARESWELILLKGFFDPPYGRHLIFKGGTSLDWENESQEPLSRPDQRLRRAVSGIRTEEG
jgi:hypothetical protein